MSDEPDFHRPFDLRRLGEEAVVERIAASAEERTDIAAFLGILAIDRLESELSIERWSAGGIKIEGRLVAAAEQACVVTLEPVPEAIDESFRLTFLPRSARIADPRNVAEAEVIVKFDEEDPPDELEGPVLDLGPILVEQLALALDPYPRSEGAKLPDIDDSGDEKPSPFAALSRLRKD